MSATEIALRTRFGSGVCDTLWKGTGIGGVMAEDRIEADNDLFVEVDEYNTSRDLCVDALTWCIVSSLL